MRTQWQAGMILTTTTCVTFRPALRREIELAVTRRRGRLARRLLVSAIATLTLYAVSGCTPGTIDEGVVDEANLADELKGGKNRCGDGICRAGETCSSCAADCGVCPGSDTGSGSGSGSGSDTGSGSGSGSGSDTGSGSGSGSTSTDGRGIVSGGTATSPSTFTLKFSGTYATGDALWIYTPSGGYGWGCGWWANLSEAKFEGGKPGGTYRAYIRHADGTQQTEVSFTLPALAAESNGPAMSDLKQGMVYFANGPGIGVFASDDSGIARVEFFADGASIGTYSVSGMRRLFATNAAGVPFRYIQTPDALKGQTVYLRAVAYDLNGNSSELSGTVTLQ